LDGCICRESASSGRRLARSVARCGRYFDQLAIGKAHQQASSNRLEAHLSRHWPESLHILDLHSATLPALIAAYGDAAAVGADPCGAEVLMRRVGGSKLSTEKIQELLASARHSIGVPALPAERELLQWLGAEHSTWPCRSESHAFDTETEFSSKPPSF
jgi:hypothetical protein